MNRNYQDYNLYHLSKLFELFLSCMEKMFICTKMQYLEEMLLNARQLYALLNLVGMEQFVPSMKTVVLGFVTVPQGLLEPYAKDRFVQRTHASLVEPV